MSYRFIRVADQGEEIVDRGPQIRIRHAKSQKTSRVWINPQIKRPVRFFKT